jgi:hypothetical protein
MDNLTRHQVRYICFRIQTEATGGASTEELEFVDEIKAHFEQQADFGGWEKFGKTWDVDEKAHLVAVLLKSSLETNWNAEVRKSAKDLPIQEKKQEVEVQEKVSNKKKK